MQQKKYQIQPLMLEKVVAALSYLTSGFVGFFWLLLALFTKNSLKPFLSYHVFQSIFLSFLYFLINVFATFIMTILGKIPLIKELVVAFVVYLSGPLAIVIQFSIYGLILYLVVTSLQGKYSYIPWVSNIIRANVKGS